jgi:hypothetical protein
MDATTISMALMAIGLFLFIIGLGRILEQNAKKHAKKNFNQKKVK